MPCKDEQEKLKQHKPIGSIACWYLKAFILKPCYFPLMLLHFHQLCLETPTSSKTFKGIDRLQDHRTTLFFKLLFLLKKMTCLLLPTTYSLLLSATMQTQRDFQPPETNWSISLQFHKINSEWSSYSNEQNATTVLSNICRIAIKYRLKKFLAITQILSFAFLLRW